MLLTCLFPQIKSLICKSGALMEKRQREQEANDRGLHVQEKKEWYVRTAGERHEIVKNISKFRTEGRQRWRRVTEI